MIADDLTHQPLFKGFTQKQLAALAPLFWRERLLANEYVFAQGNPAGNIYILENGSIVIRFFPYDGGSLDIETIQPGGVFGWSAALGRPHYTSAAICLTDTQVIAARGSDLRRVMWTDKELGAELLDRMSQIVAHRLDSFRTQLIKLMHEEFGIDH